MTDVIEVDEVAEEADFLAARHHLTPLQRNFCYHRIKDSDGKGRDIMRRAGYSQPSINKSLEILQSPALVAAVAEIVESRRPIDTPTADRVIEELAHIAFAKVTDAYEDDGKGNIVLKNLNDLTDSQARSISEINSVSVTRGETTTVTTKAKLFDKKDALSTLGKHFGVGVENDKTLTIEMIHRELGFDPS